MRRTLSIESLRRGWSQNVDGIGIESVNGRRAVRLLSPFEKEKRKDERTEISEEKIPSLPLLLWRNWPPFKLNCPVRVSSFSLMRLALPSCARLCSRASPTARSSNSTPRRSFKVANVDSFKPFLFSSFFFLVLHWKPPLKRNRNEKTRNSASLYRDVNEAPMIFCNSPNRATRWCVERSYSPLFVLAHSHAHINCAMPRWCDCPRVFERTVRERRYLGNRATGVYL